MEGSLFVTVTVFSNRDDPTPYTDHLTPPGEPVVLDIDGSLIEIHSEPTKLGLGLTTHARTHPDTAPHRPHTTRRQRRAQQGAVDARSHTPDTTQQFP